MKKLTKKINPIEYSAWQGIKSRCYNINNSRYKDYGGRGIIVCDRWLNNFSNFLEDLGKKPGNEYSLERINNDGNYCLENCKWATKKEQNNNKRDNIKILNIITGDIYNSLQEAADIIEIERSTLKYKLSRPKINNTYLEYL